LENENLTSILDEWFAYWAAWSEERAKNMEGDSEATETALIMTDNVPTDTEYCSSVQLWGAEAVEFEVEVLRLVNEARSVGRFCGDQYMEPAGAVEMDSYLTCAARNHARDMDNVNQLYHVSESGEGPGSRLSKTNPPSGLSWNGENVAAGARNPEAAIGLWLNSTGHCRNIMKPSSHFLGIGYHGGYWSQLFGYVNDKPDRSDDTNDDDSDGSLNSEPKNCDKPGNRPNCD